MRINPAEIFERVARTLPTDLHRNVLVVGSLAAAYHHRERLGAPAVNTKDADVVVHPAGAISECVEVARRLIDSGWKRTDKCFAQPSAEPRNELRAIRLEPPEHTDFFVELLGLPEPGEREAKIWTPCRLDDGWYGIPSFRFMRLLVENRRDTSLGIQYASPELMALANLLAHPRLGTDTMSEPIGGRTILRSAKDLGRVLALARLDPNGVEDWLTPWEHALRTHFEREAAELAQRVGDGLAELLKDQGALEQALHTTNFGLLGGLNVTAAQLRIEGERLLVDVVEPLWSRFP